MRIIQYILCFFLIAMLFVTCQTDYTGKQLHDWVVESSNGLNQKVENEAFIWEVQYEPLDYMIAKESKGKELTKKEYEAIKERKEGLQYFKIKVQSKTTGNILNNIPAQQQENEWRLQYFLDEFDKDILLIENGDTLVSSLYHFERNYEALNHNNIIVAFKANKQISDKKIVFLDRVFGLGLQEVTFKKEDLEKIPTLKINNTL